MKKFFKYFSTLAIFTVILLYICDFIYTQIYIHSNPRNKLQYILQTNNEHFDIAFIGSSRVANHIDTQLFDSISNKKTINLGVEGAGLNDNLLQLKLLLNKNTVSNIFLQVDTNFESEAPSRIAISEAMPYLHHNEIINSHIKEHLKNANKLDYIPFYRYAINDPKIGFRELFFSLINKTPKIDPSIGFTPKMGAKSLLTNDSLPETIKSKNAVLNKIIKLCQKRNIQLTVYISPYCSETKHMDYIDKLFTKIPNFINLSRNYDDTLFYNCSHLNNIGATIFTIDLYNATKERIKE